MPVWGRSRRQEAAKCIELNLPWVWNIWIENYAIPDYDYLQHTSHTLPRQIFIWIFTNHDISSDRYRSNDHLIAHSTLDILDIFPLHLSLNTGPISFWNIFIILRVNDVLSCSWGLTLNTSPVITCPCDSIWVGAWQGFVCWPPPPHLDIHF